MKSVLSEGRYFWRVANTYEILSLLSKTHSFRGVVTLGTLRYRGTTVQTVIGKSSVAAVLGIECFHSHGQHLCILIGTKESDCIRKEFHSHRTGLGHKHGRRFIVLGHQYGRRDVI